MSMPPSINKLERGTEGFAKARGIIPHDWRPLHRSGPSSAKVAMMAYPPTFKAAQVERYTRNGRVFGEEVERRPIMQMSYAFRGSQTVASATIQLTCVARPPRRALAASSAASDKSRTVDPRSPAQ